MCFFRELEMCFFRLFVCLYVSAGLALQNELFFGLLSSILKAQCKIFILLVQVILLQVIFIGAGIFVPDIMVFYCNFF